MKILVVNCGSSSLKYQLIDMTDESVLAKGKCDRIGIDGTFFDYKKLGCDKEVVTVNAKNHTDAFKILIETLLDENKGVIKSVDEISGIGHRVVNGGPQFKESVLVTDEVLKRFEQSIIYAPLHNPAHLEGIYAAKEVMPNTPMTMIFDTAFHQTMPEESYLYAIPLKYYEEYGVRKYGAHGTSHKYITQRVAKLLNKNVDELNLISCHLGNGASICAVINGKSFDTSMGLTPLEGLIMGTRSGDIDPAVIEFIMKKENLSIEEMNEILNKKSGLLAASRNKTSDIRDLKELKANGDVDAIRAINMFVHRVKKYIGAYAAILGRVDAIAFAGGIAEFNPDIVEAILTNMENLGIEYDVSKNDVEGREEEISLPTSRIKALVVPTNEELMIAKETLDIINK